MRCNHQNSHLFSHLCHTLHVVLVMAKKKSASSDAPASTHASWDTASEAALIAFLLKHKSEADDGINFKALTFKKAAIYMIPFTCKCGAKSAASCNNKWARVCALYESF